MSTYKGNRGIYFGSLIREINLNVAIDVVEYFTIPLTRGRQDKKPDSNDFETLMSLLQFSYRME